MKLFAVPVLLLLALPSQAATILADGLASPGMGTVIDLDPKDFEGFGPPGSGQSVVGDGRSVVEKSDPTLPHAYGRFDVFGQSWIDSQDLSQLTWTVDFIKPFTSLTFALTDAFDQAEHRIFGKSSFRMEVDGATWSLPSREANGTLHWLTVLFDAPTTSAELTFFTRTNDGFGISSASIGVVPIPAAVTQLLLALASLGLVARFGRRLGTRTA